ncbi:MAG: hypothetical protein KF782_21265 [Labilithrix sp.]|nr:hypothetical protein [Labilithrix sp.]
MRRPALAIAVTLALGLASSASAAQGGDERDAGATPRAIAAAPAEREPDEGLSLRLVKAAVFGVVASALLLAGGVWRRGRKRRLPRPR